jgi:purine-binding chemotaxis protein CheW
MSTNNLNKDQATREEMQMLTFSLEGVSYGVDVHQVREVKNFEGVTPVPYAPIYVKGVTNLRGEVVPVIDLRKRFGLAERKSNDEMGIMVIVQDKHPIGVMVDAVMDVLTISRKEIESTHQSLITNRSEAMLGIAKHDKDLIILLDLRKIVSINDLGNFKETEKGFQVQTETLPAKQT